MTVYVDEFKLWMPEQPPPFEKGSSHLTADTLEELHAFAGQLGLKREWFQDRPRLPHYDLTERKRLVALAGGATYRSAKDALLAQTVERKPEASPFKQVAFNALEAADEPRGSATSYSLPTGLDEETINERDRLAKELAAREAKEADEKRHEDLRRSLAEQGVPVKDIEKILDDELEPSKSLEACRRAIAAGKHLLILSGGEGGGKTTAASWWLVQKREKHRYLRTHPPLFVRAARLPRWPRFRVAGATGIDPPEWTQLAYAEALVIDDLGVEYMDDKGAFLSLFDELIDIRYAGLLPTLITTNIPPAELAKRYGARFQGRVIEIGALVGVPSESRRRGGRK